MNAISRRDFTAGSAPHGGFTLVRGYAAAQRLRRSSGAAPGQLNDNRSSTPG